MKRGRAYIIGAGPGDFELLTLKAKRIIENADCIIYDRLISKDILKLAKKDAELIYLGKGNTEGGLIQDEINQTLVKKCLEGKNVARVKGGDPFVFGRGGEEIEALVENEIEFELIPGITSSISVPAYAGIPVTHRGLARSFHVFTGHTMENGKWHNFENIAKLEGTLVFLMGVKNLDLIVNDLIKYGKSPKTAVAVIEKGATENQRVTVGTLENILKLAEENKINPPAITIIGDVVNLRETFKWFENKNPAKKILVTRDKKQAIEMSQNISKRGGISLELALIEIENLKINMEDLVKYKAILFNSPNGVKAFFENIKDIRKLANIKIGAVGVKTKEVLERYKIVPDFMPNEYLVDKLAEEVVNFTSENENILIVTSDISPCDIEKYNKLYNRNYEKLVAYKTKKLKVDKKELVEKIKDVDIITFLSSSTVEAFYESLDGDFFILGDKKIASIGPMTSETIRRLGMKVAYEAETYTADGLLDIIFR
ncbi:MAG: uroporphyrinogen-III C-methyltransferase [Fusobacterium sp.]|uniref:uroporphyrinogen-III C-methyltransferase n=1 Tax=Fusobacterium sp. TaxID=68766 RepID=UPI0026DB2527|nr:uroporphyrinogen-III C-methyltransferase [Fusobacterium sp.]MDO4689703.1 uroporphyrinogen-III C-methyltransferase [Fusobacterium sp.]